MNIQDLFIINTVYEKIIEFIDMEAIVLRTICKKWKNKCIISKSLYFIPNINNINQIIKKLPYIIHPHYLEQIEIDGYKINELYPIDLKSLSLFTNLQQIHLINIFYISDKSMHFLTSLQKLESLKFTNCYMTKKANVYIENDYYSKNIKDNEEFNICEKCNTLIEKCSKTLFFNELEIISLLCWKCSEEIKEFRSRSAVGYILSKSDCINIEDNKFHICWKVFDIIALNKKFYKKLCIIIIVLILFLLFFFLLFFFL
jgi:hypothetical protein